MSDKIWIGDGDIYVESQDCETLTALCGNEKASVSCDPQKTILENLLEGGFNAPYSCMSGSCMACLAKVTSGRVYMDELYILSEDNVKAGECLTCQTYPASREIEVNYDEV